MLGSPDDAATHALILNENAIHAVLSQAKRVGPSAEFCQECDDPIPVARQKASPGCQYCVECQAKYDQKPKAKKMLTYLL